MENQSLLTRIAESEDGYLKAGQRRGQAFFNALSEHAPAIADKIRGTPDDPFYVDNKTAAKLRTKIMIWAEADQKRKE